MAFTVRDFESLVRLLDRHPEWVEALRQRLLTRELLRAPETLREIEGALRMLAEAQRRTDQQVARLAETVAALAEAHRRHYEEFVAYRAETDRRFAELAEAQRRTEERVGRLEEALAALAEAQRRTEEQVRALAETVATLAEAQRHIEARLRDIDGRLRGSEVEAEYLRYPRRYRHLIREPHILSAEEREALVAAAEAQGVITPEEAEGLEAADVVVRGRRREGEGEAYAVVEISATVHTGDVERASDRAAALRKAVPGVEVLAVVAGPEIHPLAVAAARERGVWWLTDGRAFAPHEIPERGALNRSATRPSPGEAGGL